MNNKFTSELVEASAALGGRKSTLSKPFAAERSDVAELAARIAGGENEAEEELYHRYKDGVQIIVRQIVKNVHDAKDVSQDTFRLVLEKIRRGEVREPSKLSGYVCGIARNLAIEHLRRVKRREMPGELDAWAAIPDPSPDQRTLLAKKEKANAVRQVLGELRTRDREALLRFYLAEDDKKEICRELGLSESHFKRVLYRARERFRLACEKKRGASASGADSLPLCPPTT